MAAKTVTCRCKVVPEAGVTDEQMVAEFRALGLGEIGFFKTKDGRTGVLSTHGLIEPDAEDSIGTYVRYVIRASVLSVNPAEAGGIEIEVSYRAISDGCREGDDRDYGCAEDRPTLDLCCGSRIVARGSWNDMRDRFVKRVALGDNMRLLWTPGKDVCREGIVTAEGFCINDPDIGKNGAEADIVKWLDEHGFERDYFKGITVGNPYLFVHPWSKKYTFGVKACAAGCPIYGVQFTAAEAKTFWQLVETGWVRRGKNLLACE